MRTKQIFSFQLDGELHVLSTQTSVSFEQRDFVIQLCRVTNSIRNMDKSYIVEM